MCIRDRIDAVLERRRNAAAELVPHKGPAVKGNIVHIDYEGLLDGKPFQGCLLYTSRCV